MKPLLLTDWDTGDDPTGWFMSEKYDGVRAMWDGHQLLSRSGHRIHACNWFTDGWPDMWLDGELWAGYNRFWHVQKATNLNRKQIDDSMWIGIYFMVFDAPDQSRAFVDRRAHYACRIGGLFNTWPVLHWSCESRQRFNDYAASVLLRGGEGVVLRKPGALYVSGRSKDVRRHIVRRHK